MHRKDEDNLARVKTLIQHLAVEASSKAVVDKNILQDNLDKQDFSKSRNEFKDIINTKITNILNKGINELDTGNLANIDASLESLCINSEKYLLHEIGEKIQSTVDFSTIKPPTPQDGQYNFIAVLDKIRANNKLLLEIDAGNADLNDPRFQHHFHQVILEGADGHHINEKEHPELKRIYEKNGGLCDLLCNHITAGDFLGRDDIDISQKLSDLQQRDELDGLETNEAHTHILEATSIAQLLLARLFRIYPCSIMSARDNHKILRNDAHSPGTKKIDSDLLRKNLDNVSDNHYIKFCVFDKKNMQGHNMLIKKTGGDQFIFFDPSKGVTKPMSFNELHRLLNDTMREYPQANACAFLNNTKFMGKLTKSVAQRMNHALDNSPQHGAIQNK
mgnify:CR=1 FL=1|tara:strand:+ start:523 stop:1692 length:1170 start_codon:yes stop_codon:yes gene_type:complete